MGSNYKEVLTVLMIVVLLVIGSSFIPEECYANPADEKMALLQKYIQESPDGEEVVETMDDILTDIIRVGRFTIIQPRMRTGGSVFPIEVLERLEQLNQAFEQISAHHTGVELYGIQSDLAELSYQAGDIDQSIAYYQGLLDLPKLYMRKWSTLELATIYIEQGQFDQAKQVLMDFSEKSKRDDIKEIETMKGLVALAQRDLDWYRRLSKSSRFANFPHKHDGIGKLFTGKHLEIIYNNLQGQKVSVKGVVTKKGEPLSGVVVFLAKDSSFDSWGSGMEFEHLTITDDKGRYRFYDMEPGNYQQGIALSHLRIEDSYFQSNLKIFTMEDGEKITKDLTFVTPLHIIEPEEGLTMEELSSFKLRWEPHPEAAHYDISLGIKRENGSWLSPVMPKVEGTETVVDLATLDFPGGVSFNSEGIDPASILGINKMPVTYIYSVTAVDADGNTITKSKDPYYKHRIEYTNDSNLTEADKLLIDREYDKALAAYEENLKEDPKDTHSLKTLGLLYLYGYKMDGPDGGGKDKVKAYNYLSRAYQLTRDDSLLNQLRGLAISVGHLEEAEKYLTRSMKLYPDNGYLYNSLGWLRLYQGAYNQAEDALLKSLKKVERGQAPLMILYLLQGREEEAVQIEHDYPYKYHNHNYPRLLEEALMVLELKHAEDFFTQLNKGDLQSALESLPDNETGKFYRTLALFLEPDYKKTLYQAYEELETTELKKFIEELGRELITNIFPTKIR